MVLHPIKGSPPLQMLALTITCGLLAVTLVLAAIHQLLALARLAPRRWLRHAWASLAALLCLALLLAFYAMYIQLRMAAVTYVEALDTLIHLVGAAFILAVALLSRRTAGDILRSAFFETAALTDDLTQLPNRRHFDSALPEQVELARRRNHPLALVMLDIDHFKQVNDRYGHSRGDSVLEHLGELLLTTKRASDTAFRVGGEEFAIIAPRTTITEAHEMAERMRRAVEHSGTTANVPAITISLGIAALKPEDNISSLMDRADAALYQAKHAGRNRTRLARADVAKPDVP
ncbi:GGDEF domain-containing protein [Ancylobacter pratisalsi]|uniref:diguanylate cyclase n=1 Tax=Ancylobacter pratisalsi TaxID=1745854 RepID=A0A6P1YL68_9HYPH|nr:GGDEF domain-containing protein [Ancylobacter pratisalsi]QIB32524.1 GGDEF domain-containing protein [Ancylobacter pratisalsi]